jgi:hypothetical protein
MKTQEEFLKEILDLKKANPEMDIHFCVDNDELSDNCGWTYQKIYKTEIGPWFIDDERVYTDEDDILDYFFNILETEEDAGEETERKAQEKYDKEVKKAILVFTMAG